MAVPIFCDMKIVTCNMGPMLVKLGIGGDLSKDGRKSGEK
jgi:hypothetical protein